MERENKKKKLKRVRNKYTCAFPISFSHMKVMYVSARSAGAEEDTDCISAEGWDSSLNEYPKYDTKQYLMARF